MLVCNLNEINKVSFTVNMNGVDKLESSKVCFDILLGEMRMSFNAIKDSLNSFEAVIPPMAGILEAGELDCEIRILLGTRLFTPAKSRILFLNTDLDVLDTKVQDIKVDKDVSQEDEIEYNNYPEETIDIEDDIPDDIPEQKSIKPKNDLLEQINSTFKTARIDKPKSPSKRKNKKRSSVKSKVIEHKPLTLDFSKIDALTKDIKKDFVIKEMEVSTHYDSKKTPDYNSVCIKKSNKVVMDDCSKKHKKSKKATKSSKKKKKKVNNTNNENKILIKKSNKVQE